MKQVDLLLIPVCDQLKACPSSPSVQCGRTENAPAHLIGGYFQLLDGCTSVGGKAVQDAGVPEPNNEAAKGRIEPWNPSD